MPFRILFFTDNFPPEVNAPATRTYEHAKAWIADGAEVTVVTCAPNFPQGEVYPGYSNKLFQTEEIDGIKVVRVWSYMAANKGFSKRILDYLSFSFSAFWAGLFLKCDVMVATSPQFFTTLPAYFLSILKRRSWFFEVRDLWPESIRSLGAMSDSKALDLFEKLELFLYSKAKAIVVVTEAFRDNLIKRGVNESNIHVVPNGCNTSLYYPREKNVKLIHQLGLEERFVLGYIGTHGMAHSLDFVIESFRKLDSNKFALLLIGDGAEKQNLMDKVTREQIEGVFFHDPVKKDDVPAYLSICDVCLAPLRKSETFLTVIPSKIFETAAMGKPILLGVNGQARKIVEDYGSGFYFEPENEGLFVDVVEKVFCMSSKMEREVSTGCRRLVEDYKREHLARKMLLILKSNT